MQVAAEVGQYRGFPMLYLSGELDMASEAVLKGRLAEFRSADRCALLHVDHVTYVDSAAVGMFLRLTGEFEKRGGTLAFVCCEGNVLRVLETLGLREHFEIFNDIDEAAEHLQAVCGIS